DFANKRWRPDPSDNTGLTPDPDGLPYTGPRAFNRGNLYWTTNQSTYFLRNMDYLRLKSLEIGYDLSKLVPNIGFDLFRIYVSGYNIFTWDKVKVIDPEVKQERGRYYPQQRIF